MPYDGSCLCHRIKQGRKIDARDRLNDQREFREPLHSFRPHPDVLAVAASPITRSSRNCAPAISEMQPVTWQFAEFVRHAKVVARWTSENSLFIVRWLITFQKRMIGTDLCLTMGHPAAGRTQRPELLGDNCRIQRPGVLNRARTQD